MTEMTLTIHSGRNFVDRMLVGSLTQASNIACSFLEIGLVDADFVLEDAKIGKLRFLSRDNWELVP